MYAVGPSSSCTPIQEDHNNQQSLELWLKSLDEWTAQAPHGERRDLFVKAVQTCIDGGGTTLDLSPESFGLSLSDVCGESHILVKELPPGLFMQFPKLTALDLTGTEIAELPENIGNCRALQSLNLSYTKVAELPDSIGNCTDLESLDLSQTKIRELPDSIGNCTALKKLKLFFTSIEELPDSIGNCAALQKLNLSHAFVEELPDSIGNCTALEVLDLFESCAKRLPENIGNCTALKTLIVRGTDIRELPDSIFANRVLLRNLFRDLMQSQDF